MSNVLVTGASGFIGANLVRDLINTKDQIHILIRKQSNLWRLNNIISKCNVHFVDISTKCTLHLEIMLFKRQRFDCFLIKI